MLPADNINTLKYFTAKVKGLPSDPDAPIRQQIYFRALKTIPNLEIIYGHFLTHKVNMPLVDTNPQKWAKVYKTEEKGSDVNLAAHLLLDAFQKKYDVAVLITNDSDLYEPVKMVRDHFRKSVGIINPHDHHSKKLSEIATFLKRIRTSDLAKCQFPDPLRDSKGYFHKPKGW